jgi:hypothetical protein
MAALKVGMKIMVPWKLGDTLGDNIYVVGRVGTWRICKTVSQRAR